ncbi:AAA family ATPase [bacterium]|nr:AAA family ATPase [bacterium]
MSTNRNIDSLTIKGFKSIRHLEKLKLNRLNVLIGANGAGKSNFVSFFRMLGELVEQRLQVWVKKQGGADRILTNGVKETSQLGINIEFEYCDYEVILEPTVADGFVFVKEVANLKKKKIGSVSKNFGAGHPESKLKLTFSTFELDSVAIICYCKMCNWKVYHFHDTSDTAGVKRLCSLHDNGYLRKDASNLAAYLYFLRHNHPDCYEHVIKIIRLAIPFFDDFVLKPQSLPSEEEQIRLLWKQKDSDYPLWPNQLSDGSIRFIGLATALLQPSPPSTIVIDEPELGLHPYAITLLGSLMRSNAERMQIIVSTQSVPLLNEFSLEDIIVVERDDNASTFRRLEEKEFEHWLEEYSIGELWEKNILGGRPGK